jgi:hypothetical protein
MSSLPNLFNFVIYPDYFNKYDFLNPSYEYDIKQYIGNKNGLIVLFTTPKLPDFYEILTRGDGSCFYYSLEKVNSEFHLQRKLNYLKSELKDVFKTDKNINIENYLPIPPKTINDCICEIEKNNSISIDIKDRIKCYYNNYINNHIGFGLELYDVMKEIREFKLNVFIHILPLPQKQLDYIIKNMNFSEEEIEFYDYKLQKDIKMFKEDNSISNEQIIHILLRREHYSRLVQKDKLMKIKNFCDENNFELKIIDLPD